MKREHRQFISIYPSIIYRRFERNFFTVFGSRTHPDREHKEEHNTITYRASGTQQRPPTK